MINGRAFQGIWPQLTGRIPGRCIVGALLSASATTTCQSFSYLSSETADSSLQIVMITGSSRTAPPPLVLGPRVRKFIISELERRGNAVHVLDPLELELPLLQKPGFAYARNKVPDQLQELREVLSNADAYVTVTPEYNHAPSPALLNILNYFGSSVFSFKPSAIVSYSAGQWGGTRAALALRPFLSELGCLPVSAMVHIPKAQEALDEDGIPTLDTKEQWNAYVDRCFSQLEWWASATKAHRAIEDPLKSSPAFREKPSQRNAPSYK